MAVTPPDTRTAFAVEGVSKMFAGARGEVLALDDVSLELRDGSFTCIVGPSCCV
jgi:NitT/TauT family transport system ATP-binding protein